MEQEKPMGLGLRIVRKVATILWCLILVSLAWGLFRGWLMVWGNSYSSLNIGVGIGCIILAGFSAWENRIAFHVSAMLILSCMGMGIWGVVFQHNSAYWPTLLAGGLGFIYSMVKIVEYRNFSRRNLIWWGMLIVIGFASMGVGQYRKQTLVRIFERVLADANLMSPGKGNYACILDTTGDASVIFLGESPHHTIDLRETVMEMTVYLAEHANVRVLGCESLYGFYPFLEAESLEGQDPNGRVDPLILQYNQAVPDPEKILVTSLDIEHSINHSKHYTIAFLKYLAEQSNSSTAQSQLTDFIPQLSHCLDRDTLHTYLNQLEDRFNQHQETFNQQSWDEITFAFEMMRASVDFQMYLRENQHHHVIDQQWIDNQKIRARYFRKTIERALAKSEQRHGALVCYVGGGHAIKTDLGYYPLPDGPKAEAHYFNQEESKTKGRVASILIHALSFKDQGYRKTFDLEDVAYRLMMGQHKTLFIPLSPLSAQEIDLSKSKYFAEDGPKYDGVLFIRDVTLKKR